MTFLVSLIALACFICVLVPVKRLYTNYRLAKQTGLPIFIVPFNPYSIFWRIGSKLCAPLLQHVEWCRLLDTTFTWEDDANQHAKYGETFIVVSPGLNIIYTCDKVAIDEVLAKRKIFIKPKLYESMDIFGKNVDTVNGEDWARHRKITAPCFNERVSRFVWDESVRQSNAMLAQWLSQPGGKISNMVDDTRVIALHVLYAAGFGVKQDFDGGVRIPAPGHQLSHRDALMTVLNNLVTSIIVTQKETFLNRISKLLSPRLNSVLLAIKEFRQYTDEAIASERKLLSNDRNAQKHNLMSTLIRTSDQAQADGFQSAGQLTDDEIKGNIFIFNLAGHDTTANTLAYAFALLAIYPDVQRWVNEEVDQVLQDDDNPNYEEMHPRLKRVLAVMYETLRLYGAVPQIPRGTIAPNVPLTITNPNPTTASSTSTIFIPPNTELVLNMHAMHTSPTNYADHITWNPKRWITSPSTSQSVSSVLNEETFLHMDLGFAAWAGGPRICPGMKFAQVEFTGVLSTVLRKVWVAPSTKGSEKVSETVARKEVLGLVRDSANIGATLSMRRPEELWLKVRRR
ncbi:hypothetical protein N0V90_002536 [Kalmusia sp. IMI 367209]|nr:hypothetical protein N0V90_002536 [Kalmusia sp. IMI 367209]